MVDCVCRECGVTFRVPYAHHKVALWAYRLVVLRGLVGSGEHNVTIYDYRGIDPDVQDPRSFRLMCDPCFDNFVAFLVLEY